LVEAMIRMMEYPDDLSGPINIGNPTEFTIKELADLVIELTGSKSRIVYEPLPMDDPKQRCPDITLAKKYLDWFPTVSLRDGLAHTIEWFRSIDLPDYRPPTMNY
jgi:UDP-glucuronate decarboxylase